MRYLPDLLQSCTLLEDFGIEIEGFLWESWPLRFDEVIPLPHLRSFTQTLHLDRHSRDNGLAVVLRCLEGERYNWCSFLLPDLRHTSYFANLKLSLTQNMENVTSYIRVSIDDKGTQFTVRMEFKNVGSVPLETEIEEAKIGPSMPGIEVLCIDSTGEWVPLEDFSSLTTLTLSGLSGFSQLNFLAELGDPHIHRNLHTLVPNEQQDEWSLDPVLRLFTIAKSRAQAGLPLRAITLVSSELAPDNSEILEEVRGYVERLELLRGDDALDWDLDKYLLG